MLSKAITAKLNEQINLEFYSSNVYLQMSAWCDNHGYEGAAAFLLRHAAPKHDYTSLKEVFETTLAHEKLVTSKINELVECTFAEKDYSSFNFLQWYVAEQHEEEKLFNSIVDKFKLLGDSGTALYYIDRELKTL